MEDDEPEVHPNSRIVGGFGAGAACNCAKCMRKCGPTREDPLEQLDAIVHILAGALEDDSEDFIKPSHKQTARLLVSAISSGDLHT